MTRTSSKATVPLPRQPSEAFPATGASSQPVEVIDAPGELAGPAVEHLSLQLESLVLAAPQRIVLNLERTHHLSFAAQVMILGIARAMRRKGGELELAGPSAGLRTACRQLDLFGRVRTSAPLE